VCGPWVTVGVQHVQFLSNTSVLRAEQYTSKYIMKYTPHSYYYVRQPRLLKRCVSIAVDFCGCGSSLDPLLYYNTMNILDLLSFLLHGGNFLRILFHHWNLLWYRKQFIDGISLHGVLTYSKHFPVDKFQPQEATCPAKIGYFNLYSLNKLRRSR
jgi:hypothetical protein